MFGVAYIYFPSVVDVVCVLDTEKITHTNTPTSNYLAIQYIKRVLCYCVTVAYILLKYFGGWVLGRSTPIVWLCKYF